MDNKSVASQKQKTKNKKQKTKNKKQKTKTNKNIHDQELIESKNPKRK